MKETIGVIELPIGEILMGDYRRAFSDPRLKFASLWFDIILFEDLWNSEHMNLFELMGQRIDDKGKPPFSETVAQILSLSGAHDDSIKFFQEKWRGIYDSKQQDYYLDFDRKQIRLSKEVNSFIAQWEQDVERQEISKGWHPIDASKESMGRRIGLERAVSQSMWLPYSTTLIVKSYLYDAMHEMGKFLAANNSDVAQETIKATVPNISNLTWDKIADACQTSRYESLRRKVRDISEARRNLTIEETKSYCQSTIQNEMTELIKLQKPNALHKNVVQGILGNTTPLGWVYSSEQAIQHKMVKKNYNWLYFLLDLDDMTKNR